MSLLSIVIPTRNRSKYLESAIRIISEINPEAIETVIADNSDSDPLTGTLKVLVNQHKITYYHNSATCSSVDNFSRALSLAKGKYVCVIGDDDLVSDEIVEVAKWASANHIDAILDHNLATRYSWPDVTGDGVLKISYSTSPAVFTNPQEEFEKCLLSAGVGMQRMPKVYLGLTRRETVIDKLLSIPATSYGTCPDMFTSVISSKYVKRCVFLDHPLVIPGASIRSGAGDVIRSLHQGELHQAPHFRGRGDYSWPKFVPRFYSVESFWAESTIRALEYNKDQAALKRLNYLLLYLVCWYRYREFRQITLEAFKAYCSSVDQRPLVCMLRHFPKVARFAMVKCAKNLVGRGKCVEVEISKLPTSYEALGALRSFISARSLNGAVISKLNTALRRLSA